MSALKIDKKIVAIKEVNPDLPLEIQYDSAPRRPPALPCEVHRARIKGEEWTIFVGLLKGDPYEMFGGLSSTIEIPKKYKHGRIEKRVLKKGSAKYDLVVGEDDDELKIKDFVNVFDNPNHSAFTRLLSLSMRHGTPIQYIVEQLLRDKDADFASFARVTARVLKKYIQDGTVRKILCPNCSSTKMAYQGGCLNCTACGWEKC